MSEVRHKTVRKKIGAAKRDVTSSEEKLLIFRALYLMLYNDARSIIPLATELFHISGDILEGIAPENLDLHQINKKIFLQTIDDLKQTKVPGKRERKRNNDG